MTHATGKRIESALQGSALEAETLVALLKAADIVGETAHPGLTPFSLSAPQYDVLRILRQARESGVRTYDVAAQMVSRAPNITRLADKLEAKGLLERIRSSMDRRSIRLRLTPAGDEVLQQLDQRVSDAEVRAMRGLDQGEIGILLELLNRLCQPLKEELVRKAGQSRFNRQRSPLKCVSRPSASP
jgi:DNA-binding MarR family transcriptional regulator